jgi:arylsulfatase A-like enzyme
MNRRRFLGAAASAVLPAARHLSAAATRPPNILLILADDLGYGDLGAYGSRVRTPNIDRLAAQGAKFTTCYAAANVCSPSRAALLTGRYATRSKVPTVLAAADRLGLPDSETTLPSLLKQAGYRTSLVGKWHLGTGPTSMPLNRGFDEYFGVPYSNDMNPLVLCEGNDIIEEPTVHSRLADRYTTRVSNIVSTASDQPFFCMMSHHLPHVPLDPSASFRGKSRLGPYCDSLLELDSSVGRVLKALENSGAANDTLVLFTSDNGPWFQGSRGPFRGRKGETYEGGVRVPLLARLPGRIPACRTIDATVSLMDLLPLLTGETDTMERGLMLYFDCWHIQCARLGPWKLHISRYNTPAWVEAGVNRYNLPLHNPELYNLVEDPEESYDCAADNPEVDASIMSQVEGQLWSFPPEVRFYWDDTRSRRTGWTFPGAYPNPYRDVPPGR